MKRRTVSDFLSAIPERTARVQSGSLFELPGAEGEHAAKIAHVAQYLNWLTPLYVLTRDDQVALGLWARARAPWSTTTTTSWRASRKPARGCCPSLPCSIPPGSPPAECRGRAAARRFLCKTIAFRSGAMLQNAQKSRLSGRGGPAGASFADSLEPFS